jgi:uncharacterized NAD(P)/FAD-binding protein YdhS
VAVIGGGFSGTFNGIHLRAAPAGSTVILFEENSEAGPGLAYRCDDPHALLNIPARRMSAYQDEPDHFFKFARGCWAIKSHRMTSCAPHLRRLHQALPGGGAEALPKSPRRSSRGHRRADQSG